MGWFGLNAQEKIYWERFQSENRVDVVVNIGIERTYASRIKELTKDTLVLEIPRIGNLVLEVAARTPVAVNVYTNEGVFKFNSVIAEFQWDKSSCVIAKPNIIERIQRRQSFRLEKIITVFYGALMSFDATTKVELIQTDHSAVAKNISEGGMLLVMDERFFASETFIKVQADLDNHNSVVAIAKVLQQTPHPEVPGKFITRAQFVSIADDDKESIRKFVLTHSHKE